MAPGFRYHLLTLVAVFLALGMGMVIGSSYLRDAIVDHLTIQLRELNTRFTEEVAPLRETAKHQGDGIALLLPRVIHGTLRDARVAIVQTGDYPETTRGIRTALVDAGAAVRSTTVVAPTFGARAEQHMVELMARLRQAHPNLPDGTPSILRVLARAVARSAPATDLQALADFRLCDMDGSYDEPSTYVVLVTGAGDLSASRADTVDGPLVEELRALGVTVVVAEPTSTAISSVAATSAAGASTVDNADTDLGRISVVLAMRSDRGDFGVKKTARSGIVPAFATEQ